LKLSQEDESREMAIIEKFEPQNIESTDRAYLKAARPWNSLLMEPTFARGTSESCSKPPTLAKIIAEWLDAINFFKYPPRFLIALTFFFHATTAVIFVYFIFNRVTVDRLIFMFVSAVAIVIVYNNTVWYHRYCSHAAFKFTKDAYTKLFLSSNPIPFREESYAIPHMIHHQRTEKPGDPYGPHLGWLGSYLAIESSGKINTSITEPEFARLKSSTEHIGLQANDYEQFRRFASIENVAHFLTRTTFAQLVWSIFIYSVAGASYVLSWYSAIFCAVFLMRDFNWRGHGGSYSRAKIPGWEFDDKSYALNQRFYGYLASEWHDNHHKYFFSANAGFLPGQIDIAFQIIKLMHRAGIVESYLDARPLFEKECLAAVGSN
jgi:fatty-acid desaturase